MCLWWMGYLCSTSPAPSRYNKGLYCHSPVLAHSLATVGCCHARRCQQFAIAYQKSSHLHVSCNFFYSIMSLGRGGVHSQEVLTKSKSKCLPCDRNRLCDEGGTQWQASPHFNPFSKYSRGENILRKMTFYSHAAWTECTWRHVLIKQCNCVWKWITWAPVSTA